MNLLRRLFVATTIGHAVRLWASAVLAMILLALVAAFCAGRSRATAREDASQHAERDSDRVRGTRERDSSVTFRVAHNAERHRLDSLNAAFRRADSIAADRASRFARRPAIDTTDNAALRAENHELRAIVAAQDEALADARLLAPAAFVTIDSEEQATTMALASADHFARADTLSQTLGEREAKGAHRRGIVQGIKGTVTGLAVLIIVGAVLHLAGKV